MRSPLVLVFALSSLLVILAGCQSVAKNRVITRTPDGLALTDTPISASALPMNTSPAFPTQSQSMNSCPTSHPNLTKSPDEHYISAEGGLGNTEANLFTVLWPGGVVLFYPGGPGQINLNGSLEMKWLWYRTVPGEIVITGRRLDAPALTMPEVILRGKSDGYGETGFHPSRLVFPSEGCWEVTAKVKEASLQFVTLLVKIAFEPFQPVWLPSGMIQQAPDITGLPPSIRLVYGFPGESKGEIIAETIQGLLENSNYPITARQIVTINGKQGMCVQGASDEQGNWQTKSDAGVLEWRDGDLSYRIRQVGLGLHCSDLLRIAGG